MVKVEGYSLEASYMMTGSCVVHTGTEWIGLVGDIDFCYYVDNNILIECIVPSRGL